MLSSPTRSTLFPYTTLFRSEEIEICHGTIVPESRPTLLARRRSRSRSGGVLVVILRRRSRRLRSEEHTSELQSRGHIVCRILLEKKKKAHKLLKHVKLRYS